jgi:DNA-3-methyladenine glycosylase II
VTLETTLAPRPPYSLALSARMKSDATRFLRDGVLTLVYEAGGAASLARVWQTPQGKLRVRLESGKPEEALARLRFMLAVDDDHTEFLRRFERDPLIGHAVRAFPGVRPLRTATVVHALLKAVCGQLIEARAARRLEAKLLRLTTAVHEGLQLPPDRLAFQRFTRAELAGHGLVSRKGSALLRLTAELDLERLHGVETSVAARRIERERGLVGDLGLIKLCSALQGRWADTDDTRGLLEPYGDWAGLASVYLLSFGPKAGPRRQEPTGRTSFRMSNR